MLILPLSFLVVGLALGGGLYFVSHRLRTRLQSIAEARPCKASEVAPGRVKMHGTVQAVNPDTLLTSPIEQQPCVYYRLVIEQWRSSGVIISSSAPYHQERGQLGARHRGRANGPHGRGR